MTRRILFYSSVESKKQFVRQEYYKTDIKLLRGLGYKVILSKHWYDFLFFWRYDIAFIYFYRFGLLPAAIARLYFKRVFFTGGIDYLDKNYATPKEYFYQAIFYNLCGLFSTKNIIVSQSDLLNCEHIRWLFPRTRQVVSKHCINEDSFEGPSKLPKIKLVVTLAWMARVENVIRKGVLESLELFQFIANQDPEFRMLIIGPKGRGSDLVKQRIDEMGLANCVTLSGGVSEQVKVIHLKNALIYLQLSKYEGFGIAAIEALAAGCLVVHSGAGGLKEGVGQHGLLWNSDSPHSVVPEIFALLDDPPLLNRWTQSGRKHVRLSHSMASRREAFASIIGRISPPLEFGPRK